MVVAEKKAVEATQKFNQFLYEAGLAVMQTTFEVQGRSFQYMQNTFMDGIGTFMSHIEGSQPWLQKVAKQQETQEDVYPLLNSGVEAYKRNIEFVQRTFEHGVETFRGNTDVMRDMAQNLMKKAQEQQETFWA